MALFGINLYFRYLAFGRHKFWKDVWNIAVILVIAFTTVDVVVNLSLHANFRTSNLLRFVFLSDYSTYTRQMFRVMVRTYLHMLQIILVLLSFILMFTIFGVILFQGTPKDIYFDNFLDAFINMVVCLSTANFPDVMIPSYMYSHWAGIFWVFYMSFGMLFGMPLILGLSYQNFHETYSREFGEQFMLKRAALIKGFHFLGLAETHGLPSKSISTSTFVEVLQRGIPSILNKAIPELYEHERKHITIMPFFRYCNDYIIKYALQWNISQTPADNEDVHHLISQAKSIHTPPDDSIYDQENDKNWFYKQFRRLFGFSFLNKAMLQQRFSRFFEHR